MLDAITRSTLADDVFREDSTTNSLQEYIARRTGHENALLVMSGTMGNQVAIRTHLTEPPYSVLCDDRAHILRSEAGGVSGWTGATIYGIKPQNGIYITPEEIQEHAILGDNIHRCPTKLISLENTVHGLVMPLKRRGASSNGRMLMTSKSTLTGQDSGMQPYPEPEPCPSILVFLIVLASVSQRVSVRPLAAFSWVQTASLTRRDGFVNRLAGGSDKQELSQLRPE